MTPRVKAYIEMIRNGAQEALDGTLPIAVFAKSAEMACMAIQQLLNETKPEVSQEK